jgi:gliding motility-associated-like protein
MNNGGCTDSATRKVSIKGPSGVFNYNPLEACTPAKTDFAAVAKNTVKYIWDFNDGATIFTQVPASSHSFVVPGFYIPRLILEDSSGCRVAIPGKDTIKVFDVETHISASTRVVCDSGIVAFKDSSITNDVIATYLWNFGDGQSSDQRDPVHSYTDTGHYNITLVTTTKAGCIDTAHLPNYIKIPKAPDIRIIGDTAACQPATFTFQGEFLKTDTSTVTWKWNFGNGQTSDLQQPPLQLFTASGSFQVTVVATNSSGCTDTETRTVQVRPIPKVDAGRDTTICRYSTYKLNASGADSYVWKTDATLSCTNCSSPIAKPDTLITYYVTGETIFGCINSDSITIAVKQPIEMMISNGDTLCVGESARLKASGAESYQWSPAFGLNSTNIANPIARPDSSVTYRVIGNDDHNCFSDTGYVYLKVYPIPVVEIVNGTAVSMQVGSTVKLETKNSPDVTKWKWYPANTLSCASCIETLALPRENMTYSVVAINDGGCKAKDEITVNLICNNSNIYIPNTFSPNADGMNDLFYPRGTGVFSIRSFKIYNRWGQILFQKDNIPPNNASYGWDGTHNSEKMTPDVYVYTMEVMCDNNILFPIKGNISLIR